MSTDSSALAEGFYWYGKKLLWGYVDVQPGAAEALRFFRQAGELGCSDANISIGELYQQGRGVERDARTALASYSDAAKAGNFLAIACMALVGRSRHAPRAGKLWARCFAALDGASEWPLAAASVGEILHRYIEEQLRAGAEPKHLAMLRRHRSDIIAYHQNVLEHAQAEERLNRLNAVSAWLTTVV